MADPPTKSDGSDPGSQGAADRAQGTPKLPRMTGKARWGALAATMTESPDEAAVELATVKEPVKKVSVPDQDHDVQAKRDKITVQDETVKQYKKGMTRLKFISRLNSAVRRTSAVSFGASRRTSVDPDEDFHPEARRRFLFDDTALRRGADIKELFKSEEPPEEDFNEIVDLDDRRVEVFVSQQLVGDLIESFSFRMFIFGLIVVNSALIGLQTDDSLSVEYRYVFSIFDQAVLATFTCEIILKWYHGFWIFWKVGWNVLDFMIIMALLLGPQLSFLSSSRILRILRVLRAFRSLRSISALAGLSMVVQTILQSVPDMANICLLLFIILLMLGVAGVTLFGRQIPSKFGDLQTAMFSLFVCVTQDGWVQIFELFKGDDVTLHVGGALYFFIAIMIGAFVFANLVVAVVVTNLEMAMREIKAEIKLEEDILATDTEVKSSDDNSNGHSDASADKVPITAYEEARKGVDLTQQAPLQLPTLKGLTCDKLEKYFLVLIAIEDNLAEYQNIRKDVTQMFEIVKSLNAVEYEQEDWDESEARAGSDIDLNELKKGDILSNLMMLEERKMLNSQNANDFDDVIKRSFDPRRKKSGGNIQAPRPGTGLSGNARPTAEEYSGVRRRSSLQPTIDRAEERRPTLGTGGYGSRRRGSILPMSKDH